MKIGFLIAGLGLLATSISAQAERVEVDGGVIEGTTSAQGIRAWLGVPFAAPPVRGLRWKPPQPVQLWTGVFHADRFAPECLQPLRSSGQNHYFGEEATSEDCLYLNIWSPRSARKAPVIVWIYGGGFNIGSASMANYSGEPLAREGVVRVNVAYRVGPLGFLAHPELSRESGYGGSGNYGFMDQIAALQWVRRNIGKFGGDPDNVTIVGQSAGSMSVSLLQISPLAKGLFQRAVGMSGSAFGGMLGPAPLEKAEAQGLALQKELEARDLAELRQVAGDRLVATKTRRDPMVLDGHVLTGTAEQIFSARRQNDVPILIGYTNDESFGPLGPVRTAQDLETAVRARFPETADRILAAYAGTDPARAATDIARDASVGRQVADWASYQQRFGTKDAFVYLFTRRHPYAPGILFNDHDPAAVGAYHSGDIPYWLRTPNAFNLFRQTRIWEAGDAALEQQMSQALLAFARTGEPLGRAGTWPAFSVQRERLMLFGLESQVIDWPHFPDMVLFAGNPDGERPKPGRPRD